MALLAAAVAGCGQEAPPEGARLVSVTDGDTIRAVVGGTDESIRYIGIDTPERGDPCFEEATRANEDLLARGRLRLRYDVERRDRYGRLLAYVYAGDTFVNRALVEQGFARRFTVPPNVRHSGAFGVAERRARRGRRGCTL